MNDRAATGCVGCGAEIDVHHVVSMHDREFCSLDCADRPRLDWQRERFDAPLRRYRDFAVWPDGTIMPSTGGYDLDADRDDAKEAAERVIDLHPADWTVLQQLRFKRTVPRLGHLRQQRTGLRDRTHRQL